MISPNDAYELLLKIQPAPVLLVIIVILTYILGVHIKLNTEHTTLDQRCSTYRLIGADAVLLSLSLDIGIATRDDSVFRFMNGPAQSLVLVILVLITMVVYAQLVSVARRLQKKYKNLVMAPGDDRRKQYLCYVFGGIWLAKTIILAAGTRGGR